MRDDVPQTVSLPERLDGARRQSDELMRQSNDLLNASRQLRNHSTQLVRRLRAASARNGGGTAV